MKNSTFVVVALACALVTGCRNPKERMTALPGTSTSATARGQADLNTAPFAGGITPGSSSTPETAALSLDLPDEGKLDGREMDRSVFKDQTVYFDFDQAHAKASEGSKIDQVIGAFKARSADFDLLIEGHCDERGTEEYNRSLGERRALALRELLMKSGVNGQRIYTRTFGKDQPAVPGHDEAAWSQNRRGEFILVLPKKIITTQITK